MENFLQMAKRCLGMKGKKQLSAYLVGEEGHASFRLVATSSLADDQLVAISETELAVPVEGTHSAEELRGDGLGTSASNPPALDAVRAAYSRRTDEMSVVWTPLSSQETEKVNAELLAHTEKYAHDGSLSEMRSVRASLPAAKARCEFLAVLDQSQVIIVVGETGSGKTTQVPNFILENASQLGHGGEVNIICTQPRRIAAVSVADRVAKERGEDVGNIVGHAVRLDCKATRHTRLLYCTTGVLLQRLNTSPSLEGVTHVVVDEAHERSLHTDFALTLLREVLEARPDLRLIVMSATLEQGLFEKYFRGFAFDPSDDLPVVSIPGRTFPLAIRYLPEACAATGRQSSAEHEDKAEEAAEQRRRDTETWIRTVHAVGDDQEVIVSPEVTKKPDYSLIADLCSAIMQGRLGAEKNDDGAILIFLPGYAEIDKCMRTLKAHSGIGERAWLFPLHGSLSIKQQQSAFRRPPAGVRKIVVATNIAETSITIDDVTHVIDSGHVRETRYNPQSSMNVFSTVWVSAGSAKQRGGRASRTRPGVCWRLYHQSFLETKLPNHTLAEMRRTALEELVLQLRLLEPEGDPGALLQMAPEPPSTAGVACAVQSLIAIGALENNPDMPLTPLGFHLANLPMDARTGKMLIYGALCGCLSPILTIAACLSHRSIFTRSFDFQKEERQRRARESRFGHLRSDHLAAVAAFEEYQKVFAEFGRAGAADLCEELGMSYSVIDGVAQLRQRFLQELVGIGFADGSAGKDGGSAANANSSRDTLVRCMLCAGLFPNVVQVQRPSGGQGKVVLVSREHEKCAVHPMSLNARQQHSFVSNQGWLLYHTKVQTSQIFLQDSTLVGALPLLLFGGELKVSRSRTHISTGGLLFKAKKNTTCVLFRLLRRELDRLLLLKVADPSADLTADTKTLLSSIARLLHLEDFHSSGCKSWLQ
jgi:HrpA-like RNA helicase